MLTVSVDGRYVLERELGRGAHGVVYRARVTTEAHGRPAHGPTVAIKRLDVTPTGDAHTPVVHPNLVRVLERVQWDGATWVVLELVTGTDLVTAIREDIPVRDTRRPHLPMAFGQDLTPMGESVFAPCTPAGLDRLRQSLGQLARGLAALHGHGYVHRDLCPANVRVTPTGRTVLLDVDTVLPAGAPWDPSRETGPVAWVAPELGDGVPVAPAHDWYALGVLLFECLTGDLPFTGNGADMVVRKQTVRAPRAGLLVRGVPDDLDTLCAHLLETVPSLRGGLSEVLAVAAP